MHAGFLGNIERVSVLAKSAREMDENVGILVDYLTHPCSGGGASAHVRYRPAEEGGLNLWARVHHVDMLLKYGHCICGKKMDKVYGTFSVLTIGTTGDFNKIQFHFDIHQSGDIYFSCGGFSVLKSSCEQQLAITRETLSLHILEAAQLILAKKS